MSSGFYKFLALLAAVVTFLIIALPDHAIVDEVYHLDQISKLAAGDSTHLPNITTYIYLHQVYAWLGQWLPINEPLDYRIISALIALLYVFVVAFIVRSTQQDFDWKLAAQCLCLPVVFPYLPLVYTDIPALALILLSAHFMFKERAMTAAGLGALATLIRQPSLIWLGLLTLWAGYRKLSHHQHWSQVIKVMLPGSLAVLAFGVYFLVNKSVALGDKGYHPISINLTNVYFMLMLAVFLFLPIVIQQFKSTWLLLKQKPWLLGLLIIGLPIYAYTFSVTHPFNAPEYNQFIRNWLLNSIQGNHLLLLLSYGFMSLGSLALLTSSMRYKDFKLLYYALPITVLFLPLIEQRYTMAGFTLWLLCRERFNSKVESAQLCWLILISGSIYLGISRGWFYY